MTPKWERVIVLHHCAILNADRCSIYISSCSYLLSSLSAGTFLGICTQAHLHLFNSQPFSTVHQPEPLAAQPPAQLAIWRMLNCCSSPGNSELLVHGFLSMPVQAPSLLLSQAFQLQGIRAARTAHPVSGSIPNWRTCKIRKWQDCWQRTGHLAYHTHNSSMLWLAMDEHRCYSVKGRYLLLVKAVIESPQTLPARPDC
jgi:hypothetical protein